MTDVAVIGAGAVGLTLAGRLAQHGASVTIYEASPGHQRIGSRAICMQRETLEIWARLGIGDAVAGRGVQWHIGRTYHRGRLLFEIRLPDQPGEHFPPFVNISQSEVEELLATRLERLGVPILHGHRLADLRQDRDGVEAVLETDRGTISRRFDYLVGADGAHSSVRHLAGIGFGGYTFDDRFLIADVRADLPFTNQRHFHFDPPWNPGRQVLIHPQPDGVWRIDWQVPAETDAEAERANGGLDRRIRQVVGEANPYELVWMTGYRFSQRLADGFRAGRVFLAGDAAHVMSPFGARGLNSGVPDAENLAWRLAAASGPDDPVLDGYEAERRPAAIANLAATDATMRFMAPHGLAARAWRAVVLAMAPRSRWFRSRVNSGRLAEPATYPARIGGPDDPGLPRHGSLAPDVRLPDGGRLRERLGRGWVRLTPRAATGPLGPTGAVVIGADSVFGPERTWLIRPDGYIDSSEPTASAAGA